MGAATAPAVERRRWPRTPARGVISVTVEVWGHPGSLSGTLRDLSRGGVGLNMPTAIEVGVGMEFRAVVGMRLLRAQCRVANCRPIEDGIYVVGAEMVSAERLAGCEETPTAGVDHRQVADVKDRLVEVVGRRC